MKYLIYLSLLVFMPASSWAMSFYRQNVVTACDMSTASCASYGEKVDTFSNLSFQAVITGSPVGTLKLQISDDVVPPSLGPDQSLNVVNWSDYTGSSSSVSGAENFTYNLLESGYGWIRLVYTKTSGTGTMNVSFRAKSP